METEGRDPPRIWNEGCGPVRGFTDVGCQSLKISAEEEGR